MDKTIQLQIAKCVEVGNSIAKALDELSKNRHLMGTCPNGCQGRNSFIEQMKNLSNALQTTRPNYSKQIDKWLNGINAPNSNCVNQYNFNVLMSLLQLLVDEYSRPKTAKKIFISHSSKDGELAGKFSDHILQLGIGLNANDIFCTSIEDLGVKNGDSIRQHIQENIRNADFSILMISDNYKGSEICVNEMGAVWAYNNNVRYYILPNTGFDKIGWLCDTQKADKVDSATALDALQYELMEYFQLPNKGVTWSRQRQTFLNYLEQLKALQSI